MPRCPSPSSIVNTWQKWLLRISQLRPFAARPSCTSGSERQISCSRSSTSRRAFPQSIGPSFAADVSGIRLDHRAVSADSLGVQTGTEAEVLKLMLDFQRFEMIRLASDLTEEQGRWRPHEEANSLAELV